MLEKVNQEVEDVKLNMNRSQLKSWNHQVKDEMSKYWKNLLGLSVREKKMHSNLWVAWNVNNKSIKEKRKEEDTFWPVLSHQGEATSHEIDYSWKGLDWEWEADEEIGHESQEDQDDNIGDESHAIWAESWEEPEELVNESQTFGQYSHNNEQIDGQEGDGEEHVSGETVSEEHVSEEAAGEGDWSQNGYGEENHVNNEETRHEVNEEGGQEDQEEVEEGYDECYEDWDEW